MTQQIYRHQRRPLRAKKMDYTRPGTYSITINIHRKLPMLGRVVDGEMQMNDAGKMTSAWYDRLDKRFQGLRCDVFQCMPNHLHFVLIKTADTDSKCSVSRKSEGYNSKYKGKEANVNGISIIDALHWYKTMTTNAYIRGVKEHGWPRYPQHFWQRSFYDRIIYTPHALVVVRKYIKDNPKNRSRYK